MSNRDVEHLSSKLQTVCIPEIDSLPGIKLVPIPTPTHNMIQTPSTQGILPFLFHTSFMFETNDEPTLLLSNPKPPNPPTFDLHQPTSPPPDWDSAPRAARRPAAAGPAVPRGSANSRGLQSCGCGTGRWGGRWGGCGKGRCAAGGRRDAGRGVGQVMERRR